MTNDDQQFLDSVNRHLRKAGIPTAIQLQVRRHLAEFLALYDPRNRGYWVAAMLIATAEAAGIGGLVGVQAGVLAALRLQELSSAGPRDAEPN